jgi:hypothetical protein
MRYHSRFLPESDNLAPSAASRRPGYKSEKLRNVRGAMSGDDAAPKRRILHLLGTGASASAGAFFVVALWARAQVEFMNPKVTRGPEGWAYIYIALGFALSIEATIVQMIDPLHFPWNLAAYAVIALSTAWLFLSSGWFHNKLIGWKDRYEGKSR